MCFIINRRSYHFYEKSQLFEVYPHTKPKLKYLFAVFLYILEILR